MPEAIAEKKTQKSTWGAPEGFLEVITEDFERFTLVLLKKTFQKKSSAILPADSFEIPFLFLLRIFLRRSSGIAKGVLSVYSIFSEIPCGIPPEIF